MLISLTSFVVLQNNKGRGEVGTLLSFCSFVSKGGKSHYVELLKKELYKMARPWPVFFNESQIKALFRRTCKMARRTRPHGDCTFRNEQVWYHDDKVVYKTSCGTVITLVMCRTCSYLVIRTKTVAQMSKYVEF